MIKIKLINLMVVYERHVGIKFYLNYFIRKPSFLGLQDWVHVPKFEKQGAAWVYFCRRRYFQCCI